MTCELFQEHGYPTQLTKKPGEVLEHGFFHSLGHGVGLEVHEQPWLGRDTSELVAGDVVAVEPGLYRPGFGGCRLEDIVLVTEDGAEVLTDFPYDLAPSWSTRSRRSRPSSSRSAATRLLLTSQGRPMPRRTSTSAASRSSGRRRAGSGSHGSRTSASCSTGSRRTRGGTSGASSTFATTASTVTSRPARASRSLTTGKASRRMSAGRLPSPISRARS